MSLLDPCSHDTSREAVERCIQHLEREQRDPGVQRTLRALLAERDSAVRNMEAAADLAARYGSERDAAVRDLSAAREALVADMYWMADDPERPESDPREHACVNGLCPGEYFEVSRAVSLGNAWAVVITAGDDEDIDCEVVETEDAAKRRCNEIRAALAAQPAAEGRQG